MNDQVKNILLIGAVGAAVYWLYKSVGLGNAAVNSAARNIANAYVDLTSGPSVGSQMQGQILFPDGTVMMPATQLPMLAPHWVGNSLQFLSMGTTYRLSPHDARGNYVATPLGGLMGIRRRVRYG